MLFSDIVKKIEDRFGKVDFHQSDNEASIYFRATKPDKFGKFPAILVLHFLYKADKWWITNKDLTLPLWDCLRNQCKVGSY